jgi:hypothetical protein
MGTKRQIEFGSRWLSNVDGKTVYVVMDRKPFGVIEVKREDRMVFGKTTQRALLAWFTQIEGRSDQYKMMQEGEP